jgi:Phycobilisome protein
MHHAPFIKTSDFKQETLVMDKNIETMLRSAEGRYVNSEEARQILSIISTYERRLAICSSLQDKEATITQQTTELMLQKYPAFRERYLASEKTQRDLSITLRYIGHAILRNDEEFLREKLLYWMQGIFVSKSFGETVKGTYEIMKKIVEKELPPQHASEVLRYLDVCIASCARPQDRTEAA